MVAFTLFFLSQRITLTNGFSNKVEEIQSTINCDWVFDNSQPVQQIYSDVGGTFFGKERSRKDLFRMSLDYCREDGCVSPPCPCFVQRSQ